MQRGWVRFHGRAAQRCRISNNRERVEELVVPPLLPKYTPAIKCDATGVLPGQPAAPGLTDMLLLACHSRHSIAGTDPCHCRRTWRTTKPSTPTNHTKEGYQCDS